VGSIAARELGEVVIGVDPHPGSHTFSAVDVNGGVIDELRIENTDEGRQALWTWAEQFPQRRWAVEGPGNRFAKSLVNELLEAGEQLHAVTPAMTAEYRKRCRRGKDDEIDAGSAARAALANDDIPRYEPAPYEAKLKELTRAYQRLISQCKSTRMALKQLDCPEVQQALRRVVETLEKASNDLKKEINKISKRVAPELLARQGVGPIVAGTVLAEVGRVDRFANADKFAAYAGCAPIPWDSGAYQTRRVNPGGNRRLNWAAHIVVMSRLRIDSRTQRYRDRKIAEGKTQREVFRLLKTYVCRELFKALRENPPLVASA
jgi:transposase